MRDWQGTHVATEEEARATWRSVRARYEGEQAP